MRSEGRSARGRRLSLLPSLSRAPARAPHSMPLSFSSQWRGHGPSLALGREAGRERTASRAERKARAVHAPAPRPTLSPLSRRPPSRPRRRHGARAGGAGVRARAAPPPLTRPLHTLPLTLRSMISAGMSNSSTMHSGMAPPQGCVGGEQREERVREGACSLSLAPKPAAPPPPRARAGRGAHPLPTLRQVNGGMR